MSGLAALAEEVGVSERTLRRAINEGALRATRPTPRKLDLSLSERGYIRRSWPLHSTLRELLRTEPNVRFALLFGSMARGSDDQESDVDVLVDLAEADLERVLLLGTKLSGAVGRAVDVVRLEDMEEEPLVLADALAEGRVLVDREELWPDLRRREAKLRETGRAEEGRRLELALAGIDRLLARGDGPTSRS